MCAQHAYIYLLVPVVQRGLIYTDNMPSYLAGMSPYISLKIKKRHYEHHMIEAHKYLITWISDDISFENSG